MSPAEYAAAPPAPGPCETAGAAGTPARRQISKLRDNAEYFLRIFLLLMFVRMFVVEMFIIPSPSMTPTLLGTEMPRTSIGFIDVSGDTKPDLVLRTAIGRGFGGPQNAYEVYQRDGNRYYYAGAPGPGADDDAAWSGQTREYRDRIAVAKFLFWFSPPRRGDIVVFKTPEAIYERDKPVFIKRAAGLPGETLAFRPAPGVPGHEASLGHLEANGSLVESPPFFRRQAYEYRVPAFDGFGVRSAGRRLPRPDCTTYTDYILNGRPTTEIAEVRVPDDGVFVMGDHTIGSQDSRYWGPVPLDRLRGRAIFRCNPRYFPYANQPGFLN